MTTLTVSTVILNTGTESQKKKYFFIWNVHIIQIITLSGTK
jgi:hypothetical protein